MSECLKVVDTRRSSARLPRQELGGNLAIDTSRFSVRRLARDFNLTQNGKTLGLAS